jgi:hypothetical protein
VQKRPVPVVVWCISSCVEEEGGLERLRLVEDEFQEKDTIGS